MRDYFTAWPEMHISIREVTDDNVDEGLSSSLDTDNPELVQSSSGSSSGSSTPIITFPSDENPLVEFGREDHHFSAMFHTGDQVESVCSFWPSPSFQFEYPTALTLSNHISGIKEYRKSFRETARSHHSLNRPLGGFRLRGIVKCPMVPKFAQRHKIACSLYNEARVLPTSISLGNSMLSHQRSPRWISTTRKPFARSRMRRRHQGFTYNIELSSIHEDKETEQQATLNLNDLNNLGNSFSRMLRTMSTAKEPLAIEEVSKNNNYCSANEEDELCQRLLELPVGENDSDIIRSLRQSLQSFHVSNNAQEE